MTDEELIKARVLAKQCPSWAELGRRLSVSRQAAWELGQRYGLELQTKQERVLKQRSLKVTVYLRPGAETAIDGLAAAAGQSRSAWLRQKIAEAVQNELTRRK